MPNNDYRLVRIIHPVLYRESQGQGGLAEVPETALPEHYLSGWALVAEDLPGGQGPPEAPEPVRLADLAPGRPTEDSGDAAGSKAAKGGRATGGRGSGQDQE